MSESATAEVRREPAPARREPDMRTARPDLVHGAAGPSRRRRRKLARYVLFALGAVVLVIAALWYWLSGGRYVVTSDAYVQANLLPISTDVSGIVDQIPVREGEHVKQGQVLFRLDPAKFQIALDNAHANLAEIVLSLNSLKADYQKAEAQVAGQQAVIGADQATYDRYDALVKQRAIAPQQLDDARAKLASDKAALNSITANVKSELARLGGNAEAPVEQMPAYKQAAAQVAEAERELNHSIVRAPFDGVVTQVNKLQPGQYLAAGTAAFGLVDSNDMWIAAQPKETYLTYARAGQPAKVTVDAYPGHTWTGTVESIAPATDQEFSVLPAENSSGNWVKVVQRVPVRIDIHESANDPPLSAGMSAEVSIDTHHKRTIGDLF